LAAELTARGIKTDRRAVWVFLHAEGLSFKKARTASRLAQQLLELAEVSLGITAEPGAQHAGMVAAIGAGAHLPPALPVGTGEIAGVVAVQPAGDSGDGPHRAAGHGR
jgi:hypothetical protein